MSETIVDSIVIGQPPQEIFAFLSLAENHAIFIPDMLEFVQTSPGQFAQVGARARGLRRLFGVRMEIPYEIVEVEPDVRLSMAGKMGPMKFEDGYVLEPSDEGTVVSFWLRPALSGPIRLAKPLIMLVGRTHATETLRGLKSALEGLAELRYADAR